MDELIDLAEQVGTALKNHGLMLTTAESCTGGWVGQAITAIAGSSQWYDRGFVTYTNEAKQEMLGVAAATLSEFGAVSEHTVQEMAAGALKYSRAHIALAVSGVAGPGGGTPQKPVGMVCIAWAQRAGIAQAETFQFAGDRAAVRRQAVAAALTGLLSLLRTQIQTA